MHGGGSQGSSNKRAQGPHSTCAKSGAPVIGFCTGNQRARRHTTALSHCNGCDGRMGPGGSGELSAGMRKRMDREGGGGGSICAHRQEQIVHQLLGSRQATVHQRRVGGGAVQDMTQAVWATCNTGPIKPETGEVCLGAPVAPGTEGAQGRPPHPLPQRRAGSGP
jgi:hypothetical protein